MRQPSAVQQHQRRLLSWAALLLATCACTKESRTLGPEQPQTPPAGASDPRSAYFEGNAFQISQGGRYFGWYGCAQCHNDHATGATDLPGRLQANPLTFARVYDAIAHHPGTSPQISKQIPVQQLWQIAAYVRSLPALEPELRRRQDLDMSGEPQGKNWSGPVR
jgi:mono/diheme cytochrome c family protein